MIELMPGLKRDVKDRMIKNMEEQKAAQGQGGQMQQQLAAAEGQAKLAKTEAETQKTLSLASKTNVEAQRLALGY
jgi:hypothetical protein